MINFFARQLGNVSFLDRFIDSSGIVFQGMELQFAPGTQVYFDSDQLRLCVWETIPEGSGSVYTEEGIQFRAAFRGEDLR